MTKKELRRAAYLLRSWGDVLHSSHKDATGVVREDPLRCEIAEMRVLSRRLYALARDRFPKTGAR